MENKKTKLTISGNPKKTLKNSLFFACFSNFKKIEERLQDITYISKNYSYEDVFCPLSQRKI